jgi:hypothetical protein
MDGQILERTSTVPKRISFDADLAHRCACELGYRELYGQVEKCSAERILLSTLAEHEISWFDPASVTRYKAKLRGPTRTMRASAWVGTLLGAGSLFSGFSGYAEPWNAAIVGVVALVVLIVTFNSMLDHHDGWKWTRVDLSRHQQPIPLFALETALRITQALPGARFHVETFGRAEQIYDPFLIVTLDGAEAYVEVWDEPSFEGVRV